MRNAFVLFLIWISTLVLLGILVVDLAPRLGALRFLAVMVYAEFWRLTVTPFLDGVRISREARKKSK